MHALHTPSSDSEDKHEKQGGVPVGNLLLVARTRCVPHNFRLWHLADTTGAIAFVHLVPLPNINTLPTGLHRLGTLEPVAYTNGAVIDF